MTGAFRLLAFVLAALAIAMLVPALLAEPLRQPDRVNSYVITAAVTAFFAGGIYFASRRPDRTGHRSARYLIILAIWLLPPIFAAVPLVDAAGGSYVDALFEAVSGFTTTGMSVFTQMTDLGRTDLLWRAELHWLGGFVTLVLIMTILAPAGIGGIPGEHLAVMRGAVVRGGVRQERLVRDLFVGYASVTAFVVIALALAGLPAFDAVCLGFSAVSTGGFMPVDGGIAGYANPTADVILTIAMLVGATSLLWHRMILGGRWQGLIEHRESYFVIAFALIVGGVFAVAYVETGEPNLTTAIRQGLLSGASLVSTSGMPARGEGFVVVPLTAVLLVVLIGGGAFSASGGFKGFRIGALLVESARETGRLIHPHGVQAGLFGTRELDLGLVKAIASVIAAGFVAVAVTALVLSMDGFDFPSALTAATSAFANVGGVYGSNWAEAAEWTPLQEAPATAKLALGVAMIAGRLEVVALVVAASVVLRKA